MNEISEIPQKYWLEIPHHYQNVVLDEFIIMPNHVHGIIVITDSGTDYVGAIHELPLHHELSLQQDHHEFMKQRRQMKLPKIIGRFKMITSKHINRIRQTPGIPVWQRNYYERIIRNEEELHEIREYIVNNPVNWENDDNYRD
ncbi:transposase [candidate division KSB1 bacterium]